MPRIRTGYSFHTAVGHLDDVAKRLKAIGWQHGPITDRNSTYGYTRWTKVCKEHDLKPIYGVELAVVPNLTEKKPPVDFWTFIAKDNIRSINDLVYLATSQGRYPCLTYAQALSAEGVFKIAGERCLLEHIFNIPKDCFISLSPATSKGLYNAARDKGLNFVACSDNFYTNIDDKEFYRVALGHRSGTQTYPQHILNIDEWMDATRYVSENSEAQWTALDNVKKIFASCKAGLENATLLTPTKEKTLEYMCRIKLLELGLENSDYTERLDKELKLIAEKQFEDYFYILTDLMQFARQNMIVGPARGSSCGSLVCYLLGITSIDPLKFDLLFERFIDTSRADLPDVDLDFSDERRDLIFEYLEDKYGKERVARLGNVVNFKPRSALKEVGKQLKIPAWQIEKVLDVAIIRPAGDARALNQLEDTLALTEAGKALVSDYPEALIACRMEGHPNTASQHAAGVLITEKPIADYVAVDARTGAAQCDKKDAETRNLLKIDALGLTQLSVFERTLELINDKAPNGKLSYIWCNQFLHNIPLDDANTFSVLNNGHYSGIFQFNGMALQRLAREIEFTHLEDFIAITALARPGPMSSAGDWIKRKRGLEDVTYLHSSFEPILKDTYGVIIFQEQVMRILREVGQMEWPDVMTLRRAMGKTLGREFFSQYGDKFKSGAQKTGVSSNNVDRLWDELCAFGGYAFNRSHAVAYGIISYWCAWFKAYHPLEFAAATLDAEKDAIKQLELLRELNGEGVGYVPMDAEYSTEKWVPVIKNGKKILVGPLTAVKGIGPATVKEILKARKENKPLRLTLAKRLSDARTEIDNLFPISAAIKRLHPDLSVVNIVTKPWDISKVQCGVDCDVVVTGLLTKVEQKNENDPAMIAKRGGRQVNGPEISLAMFIADDSDKIYAKIDRRDFDRIGRDIFDKVKAGKSLVAIKGIVPRGFRMISVRAIKYLGDME